MKPQYILTCLFLFVFKITLSQNMPIDFSDAADEFSPFGNSGYSLNTDPEDASNPVGQFLNDGSQNWQGFYIDLDQPINLDVEQVISLSFYQFDPNMHNIMLKLEGGTDADVEVVRSNSGTGWENNITFNFGNATYSGTNISVDASGTYTRLTIFIDGGDTISGTYLIDDIDDGTEFVDPNALDVIYSDLVWSDEFEINGALNSSNWFQQTQLPEGGNWFNGEQQHYTNRIENSYVENGFLNIVAINESFTDQGETKQYTSARLNSKFAFTYGRVDVRAKLPFGDGTWPAIWMLGKNINEDGAYWDNQYGTTGWPVCGEIDIMEHGLGAVNNVSSALHSSCDGCFGSTMNYSSMEISDVANNYHIYSVNWSPNQITFLVDGVGFYTYNPTVKDIGTWPFFEDQYILLNIAMGGVAGTIDPNFDQSSMSIDYVRVYQNIPLSNDEFNETSFKLFPNPALDVINIKSNLTIDRVEVFDVVGKQVLTKAKRVKQLDVSNLRTGIYIVKLHSEGASVTTKILVN